MADFAAVTTAAALAAVGAANLVLIQGSSTFVATQGASLAPAPVWGGAGLGARPTVASRESVEAPSASALLGFGATFGGLLQTVRVATARRGRMARRAAELEVKEKTETKPLPYFENLPPTIIQKEMLDLLLSTLPKEQWDNPPEDSYLYQLKCYAEVYGKGKATRMGWWDYFYLQNTRPLPCEIIENLAWLEDKAQIRTMMKTGNVNARFPVFIDIIDSGLTMKWRGKEYFAGDQVMAPLVDSGFAKQYVDNWAFYRQGLQPWQRGLEIGMAHGYFIIGPFVSLGPLRNTPEAATVGLLAGCALIGIASVGGLLFGATEKPTLFDKPGQPKASGWQEMINWHALGGVGGAGFAHALLTVFSS